jgi:hypothetical protein
MKAIIAVCSAGGKLVTGRSWASLNAILIPEVDTMAQRRGRSDNHRHVRENAAATCK